MLYNILVNYSDVIIAYFFSAILCLFYAERLSELIEVKINEKMAFKKKKISEKRLTFWTVAFALFFILAPFLNTFMGLTGIRNSCSKLLKS